MRDFILWGVWLIILFIGALFEVNVVPLDHHYTFGFMWGTFSMMYIENIILKDDD